MKAASILLSLGALAAGVVAEFDPFEAEDFNVTEALLDNGFNVSEVPDLAELAARSSNLACSIACKSLKLVYGSSKVLFEGSSAYDTFTSGYWSAQQGSLDPYCVFKPTKALEVSSMVLLSRLTQCPFAVKGGGHAAFAGASSIDGGITVSMENFKTIKASSDKTTVDIGPGNRWVEVYTALDALQIGVVGGRMAPVGVPGLILGGGISFFSNKQGWACDNVASFEVVTASGLIVTASPTKYADLYWALRGGGNNFGIVTNFKLEAFPLGQMWGGQRIYTENNLEGVLDALYWFANGGSDTDLDGAQIASFGNLPGVGKIAIAQLHHAKANPNSPVFQKFNALTPIMDSTGFRTVGELAILMNEGSVNAGLRQTQWDVSLKVNREIFSFLVNTFYSLHPTIADAEGAFPTISIQVVTDGQLAGMQKKGGNPLGLDRAKGPYFVMNMSSRWTNAADDARIAKFFSTIIKTVKAKAKELGCDNEYIYMNYASQYFDVIGSYGSTNAAKLRSISKKYDPAQIFQRLQPGHFKLASGAPDSQMP